KCDALPTELPALAPSETSSRIAAAAYCNYLGNPPKRFSEAPLAVDPCPHGLKATRMGVSFEFDFVEFMRRFRPYRLAFFEVKCGFETAYEHPLVTAGNQMHLDALVLLYPASFMREGSRIEIGAYLPIHAVQKVQIESRSNTY